MASRVHGFAIVTALCALGQIVIGALVTSKEAGLSIPDWPLNYGRLVPQLEGGIVYEYAHRLMALLVGTLTTVLAVWLWRADQRAWVRPLGFLALGGVLLQITLGGMAVLMLLPAPVSSLHAALAQILFAALCVVAQLTGSGWHIPAKQELDGGVVRLRVLASGLPAVVLIQILLGAAARHKALGYVWHIAAGSVVGAMILWATVRILLRHANHPTLRRGSVMLMSLLFAQIFLGIAAYMSRLATADAIQPQPVMVMFTALHVATGALVFASTTTLAVEVQRSISSRTSVSGAAFGWAPAK